MTFWFVFRFSFSIFFFHASFFLFFFLLLFLSVPSFFFFSLVFSSSKCFFFYVGMRLVKGAPLFFFPPLSHRLDTVHVTHSRTPPSTHCITSSLMTLQHVRPLSCQFTQGKIHGKKSQPFFTLASPPPAASPPSPLPCRTRATPRAPAGGVPPPTRCRSRRS